ncbi:hypothetical protein [Seinonella peptonophila]|uniref:hypothetical protein n=1 Tax=Seinonella peptonophila TaxID=112248 RepID=UPI0015878C67|nr:hypothetical protein [Seinonella peptonophila]
MRITGYVLIAITMGVWMEIVHVLIAKNCPTPIILILVVPTILLGLGCFLVGGYDRK